MAEAKKPKVAPTAPAATVASEITVKFSVCAKQAGFRRAGRAWPAVDTIVDADEFTAEQIEQLLAEPMLVVLPIADSGK